MICWEKDGVGFVVKDVVAFTREILPKYFRHGNFSSFVRQVVISCDSAQHVRLSQGQTIK